MQTAPPSAHGDDETVLAEHLECSLLNANLDVNRRIPFSLKGSLQPLVLHTSLHSDQNGLDLSRPLSYAASHLAGTCVWHIVWYAFLQHHQGQGRHKQHVVYLCTICGLLYGRLRKSSYLLLLQQTQLGLALRCRAGGSTAYTRFHIEPIPVWMPLILSPALLPIRVCAFLQGGNLCQQAGYGKATSKHGRLCCRLVSTYAAPYLPAARWPMPPCEQSPPQGSVSSETWSAMSMPFFLGCSAALHAGCSHRLVQRPCSGRSGFEKLSRTSTIDPWTLQIYAWGVGVCSSDGHDV